MLKLVSIWPRTWKVEIALVLWYYSWLYILYLNALQVHSRGKRVSVWRKYPRSEGETPLQYTAAGEQRQHGEALTSTHSASHTHNHTHLQGLHIKKIPHRHTHTHLPGTCNQISLSQVSAHWVSVLWCQLFSLFHLPLIRNFCVFSLTLCYNC